MLFPSLPIAWAASAIFLILLLALTSAGSAYIIYVQSQKLLKARGEYKKLRGDYTRANERAAGFRGEKSQLLRISQDLGQPLAEVRNRLDQLLTFPSLPLPVAEALLSVDEQLKRVNGAVTALNELQQLEDRSRSLTFGAVNVGAILFEAVSADAEMAAAKSVRLSLPVLNNVSLARADPIILRKVVSNLIAHAVEVSPVGSAVALSLYHTSDRVLLTVSDEGPGIVLNDQAQLLSHSGESRPPINPQSGQPVLNLAVINNLVKAMGGWLWSQSDPGRGSTHVVELPLDTNDEDEPISASR